MKNDIVIYLCDDDINFIEMITNKLTSILISEHRKFEIKKFSDSRQLIELFGHYAADVVFLDIDMPYITGFEAAERLQKIKANINIIFVTSHEDKVFQSYEYHPFWFVRKSHLNDLDIVLHDLIIQIDSQNEQECRVFNLIAENTTIEIDIRRVKYISSYDHYILIKDVNDDEIKARCRLSDVEKQLYPLFFIRVQNSVIVNCRFITKVTSRTVILHNDEKINIGRDRIDYVKKEFQKFARSRYYD